MTLVILVSPKNRAKIGKFRLGGGGNFTIWQQIDFQNVELSPKCFKYINPLLLTTSGFCWLTEGFKTEKKVAFIGPTSLPHPIVKKFLSAKNDLHVMKRILYDTGRRTVARRRTRELRSLRRSDMVK